MKRIKAFRPIVQITAIALIGTALFTAQPAIKLLGAITLVLCGAFYCGWLCPCGFVQDVGSRLGKRLGIKKRQVPEVLHRSLVYCRYFLAVAAALWMTDILFALMGYEPRSTVLGLLSGNFPSAAVLGVLAAVTVLSMVYERPYCRYFCVEGAQLGAAGLFRVFTLRRNEHTCVQCGRCDKACPMQIKVSQTGNLRSPQCINCLECAAACPVRNTLQFAFVGQKARAGAATGETLESAAVRKSKSA